MKFPEATELCFEDPVLGAFHALLAELSVRDNDLRRAFTRHVEERTATWLPEARNRMVARVMLLEADVGASILVPESAPHRCFLTALLLEAALPVPEQTRARLWSVIQGWEWCFPYIADAIAFLDDGADSEGFVDFTSLASRSRGQAALRSCGGGVLRFWSHDGHWFARHSIREERVLFCGERWAAGHTLWVKPGESVTIGDQHINTDFVSFLKRNRTGEPFGLDMEDRGSQIQLTPTRTGEGARWPRVEWSSGCILFPTAVHPMRLNSSDVSAPIPIFPSDYLEWNGRMIRGANLLREVASIMDGASFVITTDELSLVFPDGSNGARDLSLSMQSGDFVAVMGMSGCGKSTLLSMLVGEIRPTNGGIRQMSANGVPPRAAFVPQDDVLFSELTVLENLDFAGRLRAPQREAGESLQSVLQAIGLSAKQHLRVGDLTKKVLSGGERKRLNIGLELMGIPDVLYLDEPTSGLSSADAHHVMVMLRERAEAGMLVVAVVHQPSMECFKMADKVLILDEGGTMAFWGTPSDAIDYFSKLAGRQLVDSEDFLRLMGDRRSTIDGRFSRRVYSPDFWRVCYESCRSSYEPACCHPPLEVCVSERRIPRRFGAKLAMSIWREVVRRSRDLPSLAASCAIAAILALLVSVTCRVSVQAGSQYAYAANPCVPVAIFILVILVIFLGLAGSVQELVKDRVLIKRERLQRMPAVFWLVGKLPVLAVANALHVLIVVAVAVPTLGLPPGFSIPLWWTLFLTSLCASALGLMVSAIPGMTEKVAVAAVPLLLVPQLVLSGADPLSFDKLAHLYWPAKNAPPAIAAVVPARWAYEAAIVQLREAPLLSEASDGKSILRMYNVAKKHAKLWTVDQEAFYAQLSADLGEKVVASRLSDKLALAVRGGYRTAEQAGDDFKHIFPELAHANPDLQPYLNEYFLDYARRFLPERAGGHQTVASANLALILLATLYLSCAALLVSISFGSRGALSRKLGRRVAGLFA